MAKKVSTLIKEARTAAGFTQAELAKKVGGITASDISKAERSETEFSDAVLKKIAKACGVTQASLLNAAKGTTAKKTTTASTAKKTAKKITSASSSSSTTSMKLTAEEKKLVELYRKASEEEKKEAIKALDSDDDSSILSVLGSLLGGILK